MKTNLFVPAAIVLFAVALTSCKKEVPVPVSETNAPAAQSADFTARPSTERTAPDFPLEKYSWKVGNISVNGVNLTPSYCEYGFKFNHDNSVVATKEFMTVNGSWAVSNGNTIMAMLFDQNEKISLAALNGNWQVVRITSRSVFMQINDLAYQAEVRFDVDIVGVK